MKKKHRQMMHDALAGISSHMGQIKAMLENSPSDEEAGEGGVDDEQAAANAENQQKQRVSAGGVPTAKMPGVKKSTIIAALKAKHKKKK